MFSLWNAGAQDQGISICLLFWCNVQFGCSYPLLVVPGKPLAGMETSRLQTSRGQSGRRAVPERKRPRGFSFFAIGTVSSLHVVRQDQQTASPLLERSRTRFVWCTLFCKCPALVLCRWSLHQNQPRRQPRQKSRFFVHACSTIVISIWEFILAFNEYGFDRISNATGSGGAFESSCLGAS